MNIYYLALVLGSVTAVGYVALAARSFVRTRRRMLAGAHQTAVVSPEQESGSRWIGWKALAGVVASTLVLVAISVSPTAWYLLPFLAIGSSLAVITAFLVDRD